MKTAGEVINAEVTRRSMWCSYGVFYVDLINTCCIWHFERIPCNQGRIIPRVLHNAWRKWTVEARWSPAGFCSVNICPDSHLHSIASHFTLEKPAMFLFELGTKLFLTKDQFIFPFRCSKICYVNQNGNRFPTGRKRL